MQKIIEWIKANKLKVAIIILCVALPVAFGIGKGCGYIKGCSDQKEKQEDVKK